MFVGYWITGWDTNEKRKLNNFNDEYHQEIIPYIYMSMCKSPRIWAVYTQNI